VLPAEVSQQRLTEMAALLIQANGLQGGILWSSPYKIVDSNDRMLFVWGVFTGAEVLVQISPNGEEWFDHSRSDSRAYTELHLPPDTFVRVGIRNVAETTRVSVEIK
jgi:hypothetical protein